MDELKEMKLMAEIKLREKLEEFRKKRHSLKVEDLTENIIIR